MMILWKQAIYPIVAIALVLLGGCRSEAAQENEPMVRLSKLVIDPSQLEAYKSALKEEVTDSVWIEPGESSLHQVHKRH